MTRIELWSGRVACRNPECEDHDVPRLIELPHLGDGVFLAVTTLSSFGIPVPNLRCGTCMGDRLMEVSDVRS